MKDVFLRRRIIRSPGELRRHYDVVIVGGGSHGLATAYYLAAHHGITDVAILEKSYIGSGAAGRNTTIIRANYRTPEGAAFYRQSVDLYRTLSTELRETGVSAVIVDPGDMRTRMHQEAFPLEDISDRPLPEVTIPFWRWLFEQEPAAVSGRRFAAQEAPDRWQKRH